MADIRIGTRSSDLAIWQANLVASKLEKMGHRTRLVKISVQGDKVLNKPLHKIGTVGLFTRALDNAILEQKIDLAVHSLKDVPTALPAGVVQSAVLERGNYKDILVFKEDPFLLKKPTIATGSLRRKAQWLYRYPEHNFVDLRGNVGKRLEKLACSSWQGAIFAMAGLERIGILPKNYKVLDWMVPAPAQGVIAITTHLENKKMQTLCQKINHPNTHSTSQIERMFLKKLEGGCTAPIGALAQIKENVLYFHGVLTALDGAEQLSIKRQLPFKNAMNMGKIFAEELLEKGGADLMRKIKMQIF